MLMGYKFICYNLKELILFFFGRFSSGAVVKVTGLRNPCSLLDKFEKGLKKANLEKDAVCLPFLSLH